MERKERKENQQEGKGGGLVNDEVEILNARFITRMLLAVLTVLTGRCTAVREVRWALRARQVLFDQAEPSKARRVW